MEIGRSHDGYYQKVDQTAVGLDHDPCTEGNLFCRADAWV